MRLGLQRGTNTKYRAHHGRRYLLVSDATRGLSFATLIRIPTLSSRHVFVIHAVDRLVFVELKRSWTMVGPVSVPRPGGR